MLGVKANGAPENGSMFRLPDCTEAAALGGDRPVVLGSTWAAKADYGTFNQRALDHVQ